MHDFQEEKRGELLKILVKEGTIKVQLLAINRGSRSEARHGEFSNQKHSQSRELEPPDAPCSVVVVLPPLCNKKPLY